MKRTNISKRIEADRVVVEFDEEYQAGRMLTTEAHFTDEFTKERHRGHASHCDKQPEGPWDSRLLLSDLRPGKYGACLLGFDKSYFEK